MHWFQVLDFGCSPAPVSLFIMVRLNEVKHCGTHCGVPILLLIIVIVIVLVTISPFSRVLPADLIDMLVLSFSVCLNLNYTD